MKTLRWIFAASLICALITSSGVAQDDQSRQRQHDQYSGGSSQQNVMPLRASDDRIQRLEQLRDKNVTNWKNEDLGKITDFVIDKRQGKVAYAVLSYGGALGMGEKKFAVPWNALSLTPDSKSFILDISKQKLEQSEGFKDQWPTQADWSLISQQGQSSMQGQQSQDSMQTQQSYRGSSGQGYYGSQQGQGANQGSSESWQYYGNKSGKPLSQDYYGSQSGRSSDQGYYGSQSGQYYGSQQSQPSNQGYYGSQSGRSSDQGYYGTSQSEKYYSDRPSQGKQGYYGSQYGQETTRGSRSDELSEQHPWLERASEIVGQDVVNAQNEDLGEINDLMVDVRQGRVLYAVLAHGGFLAMGEKLVPVPFNTLQLRPERNEIVLDASKDKIANAPSFTKDNWPDMSNPQWSQNVSSYFRRSQGAYFGQQQKGAWDANSSYNQQFDKRNMTTVEGRITNVSTFRPEKSAEHGYRIKVETNDGKIVRAQLGPKSVIDNQNIKLNKGDTVKLTGSMARMEGREVMMACDIEVGGKTVQLRQQGGQPCWGGQGQPTGGMTQDQSSQMQQGQGQGVQSTQSSESTQGSESTQSSESTQGQSSQGNIGEQMSTTDMNSPQVKDANSTR